MLFSHRWMREVDEGGNGGRKKTSAENVKLILILKNVKINFTLYT